MRFSASRCSRWCSGDMYTHKYKHTAMRRRHQDTVFTLLSLTSTPDTLQTTLWGIRVLTHWADLKEPVPFQVSRSVNMVPLANCCPWPRSKHHVENLGSQNLHVGELEPAEDLGSDCCRQVRYTGTNAFGIWSIPPAEGGKARMQVCVNTCNLAFPTVWHPDMLPNVALSLSLL